MNYAPGTIPLRTRQDIIQLARECAIGFKVQWEHLGQSGPLRLHIPGMEFCPITAACFQATGQYFSIGAYGRALQRLCAWEDEAEDLAIEADNGSDVLLAELNQVKGGTP